MTAPAPRTAARSCSRAKPSACSSPAGLRPTGEQLLDCRRARSFRWSWSLDYGGGRRKERTLIDWVDSCCRAWGRSTRWIIASSNKFGDPEGYPSADTIEKARQGLLSMGNGSLHGQHFREVRLNGALEVAVAMRQEPHMPLPLTATVWAHYVVEGRARQKLPALSRYLGEVISIAEYWRDLDRAHYFLFARLAPPNQRGAAVTPPSATA